QKEHLAAPIATQSLHGGVIDDFHGATECPRKIEPNPSAPKIMRFSDRSATEHWARVAYRHSVVGPICRELLHARYHLFGSHLRPGRNGGVLWGAAGEKLDRSPADIHDQHALDERVARNDSSTPSHCFHALGREYRSRVHGC